MISDAALAKAKLTAFCGRNGMKELSPFRSALREQFVPEREVDVLVEFEPGPTPGLLGVTGMELVLFDLFAGRKASLLSAEDLSPYLRSGRSGHGCGAV